MLTLSVLPDVLGICRLWPREPIPSWIDLSRGFFTVSRTMDELSLVVHESDIPPDATHEWPFHAIKVEWPLDFSLTGILSKLSSILANANISIFAISTYDTDYILIRVSDLESAKRALSEYYIINE